jgi:5-methylcytosine-specific restriction enzyme subunit McrC
MVASEWVALTEDIAENRIFKFVLSLYRPRCSAGLRAKIDACVAELDGVLLPSDVTGEWSRIRVDRLPEYYSSLLKLSKMLLNGEGSGVLSGDALAVGEIIFTSRLFERYVSKEVTRLTSEKGFVANSQSRGTFLCRDENDRNVFELIPDLRITDSAGKTRMILDAKWKELDYSNRNRGIKREDIYQLLAYGGAYGCRELQLVYPDVSLKTGAHGHYEKFSVNFSGNVYNIGIARIPMLGSNLTQASNFLRQNLMT